MQKAHNLWGPKHWPSWFAIGLVYLLAQLPYRLQMRLGCWLGDLAFHVVPSRRRVAAINLRICFPEKSAAERARILRAHFRSLGMAVMETAICWWGRQRKIEQMASIEGLEHLQAAAAQNKGILLYSAHFTPLELGVRMGWIYLQRMGVVTTAMYKPPHDQVIDYVMRNRREKHIGEASIPNKNIKGLLRALKRGRAVWYAADQHAKKNIGIMVPFFGEPASTHSAISRLAAVSKAAVVPFFTLRRADNKGYRLIVLPALENFPGEDAAADAERLNHLIESIVREAPEQYFWVHKRFERDGHNPYAGA